MKVALFYDWLNQWGGAEHVLLNILAIYPDATLFTLIHNPTKTSWLPPQVKIITSSLNSLPFSQSNPIFYTPFYDIILEQFDFSQFDLVISTTSVLGHCLLTPPSTLFITYFHNHNRHLYSKTYLKFFQSIDKIYAHRPDHFLCNSLTVQQRLYDTYQRRASVINPGVDTDFFTPISSSPQNYFLIVGRLVAHKKFDLAIHACGQLGLNLKIVGTGRDLNYLKLVSRQYHSVEFLEQVSNSQLKNLYQHSLALICPQVEDFGIAPLESLACGRPVIAYNAGGITETVTNLTTGLFFDTQSVDSLKNSLIQFPSISFSSRNCRLSALKFSQISFMLNFKKQVDSLWKKHLTTIS
ncbi:MAG: glycosyltransferase [Candidatus Shapirobacteria bacterium]|nr:glycosyltransferase [Candidatus Shapirobacteria bacterium]